MFLFTYFRDKRFAFIGTHDHLLRYVDVRSGRIITIAPRGYDDSRPFHDHRSTRNPRIGPWLPRFNWQATDPDFITNRVIRKIEDSVIRFVRAPPAVNRHACIKFMHVMGGQVWVTGVVVSVRHFPARERFTWYDHDFIRTVHAVCAGLIDLPHPDFIRQLRVAMVRHENYEFETAEAILIAIMDRDPRVVPQDTTE